MALIAWAAYATSCVAVPPIPGHVVDASGMPVVGAQVSLSSGSATATTDSSGNFFISLVDPPPYVFIVRAPGYARTSHPESTAPQSVTIFMSASDTTTTVTMPAADAPAAEVSVSKLGGVARLGIPANSLVDGRGQSVQGDVQVSMTYWTGANAMVAMPGPMLANAEDGGAPQPIVSLGMTDIEITQDGEVLQVAAGSTLPLRVTMPSSLQPAMAMQSFHDATSLYYLNPNTALWEKVAAIGTDAFQYDPNSGVLTGLLPHLSSWNFDEVGGATGCVKGRVLDCTNQPLINQPFLGWAMTSEGLKRYSWKTDSAGNYCENVGLPANDPISNGLWTFPIHLSGPDGPTDSNMNPGIIPSACVTCVNQWATESGQQDYCFCDKYNPDPAYAGYCPAAYSSCAWIGNRHSSPYFQESFDYSGVRCDKLVTMKQGTSCPSGPCDTLPDLQIKTVACGGSVVVPNPCKSVNARHIGQACSDGLVCCTDTDIPNVLVCQDSLCLPPSDQ